MSIGPEIAVIRLAIERRFDSCKEPDDFLENAEGLSMLCSILDMLIWAEVRLAGGESEFELTDDVLDLLSGIEEDEVILDDDDDDLDFEELDLDDDDDDDDFGFDDDEDDDDFDDDDEDDLDDDEDDEEWL